MYLTCNTIKALEFLPEVERAIALINNFGYKCIVITNQSGIARGIVSPDKISFIHEFIKRSLEKTGAMIDAFYFCPHHLEGKIEKYTINCDCRKPKSGMLYQAAEDDSLELATSVMIGDSDIDIEAGRNAGCESFLLYKPTIINGKKVTFRSLMQVVGYILLHIEPQTPIQYNGGQ